MAKNLLQSRCEELGPEYSVVTIDLERCIYRRINDFFDIEISGVDNSKFQGLNIGVYVWRISPNREIAQKILGIPSMDELRRHLQLIVDEYQGLS